MRNSAGRDCWWFVVCPGQGRNFVNILNVHPGIRLTGEIPVPIMRKVFTLADTVARQYGDNRTYLDNWMEKRHRFLLQTMFTVSKSPARIQLEDCLYAGTKTPNHELLFDEYERFHTNSVLKPMYVFCARNPKSCWASYRSMPWATSGLREFAKRYVQSYGILEKMMATAPGRCLVANLDQYVASEDPDVYIEKQLYEPLGLQVSDAQLETIRNLKNTNSTKAKTGSAPDPLPRSETAWIDRNRKLRDIHDRYFQA